MCLLRAAVAFLRPVPKPAYPAPSCSLLPMYSLYSALLLHHSRQLTPVRCAEQTIAQLHRYFEDVVLENNLAALVIESLPERKERSLRDLTRVVDIGRAAYRSIFFVSLSDAVNRLPPKR